MVNYLFLKGKGVSHMVQVIEIAAAILCMVVGAFIVTCGLALYAANKEARERAVEKFIDESLGRPVQRKRNSKGQFIKEK